MKKEEIQKILKPEALLNMLEDLEEARKKLEESEKKYRSLVDNSLVGVFRTTVDGKIVYVNKALADIFGERAEDLTGGDVIRYYKNKSKRKAFLKQLKRNKKVKNFEIEIITKKGVRNVLLNATLYGRYIDGMILDITDIKKAQEKILSLQRTTMDILENFPLGVYTINRRGVIDYFNPAMIKMAGAKDVNRVLGLNALKMHTYKEAGLTPYFRKGLKGKGFRVEGVKYKSLTGKKTTIRNYIGVPIKDETGKIKKLLLVVEDVTEKIKTQQELKTKEEFIKNMIEHAGIPVIAFDKNNKLLIVNKELFNMTGYNEKEINTQKKWLKLAMPSKRVQDGVKKAMKQMYKGTIVKDLVIPIRCKDGSTSIVVTNISLIKDSKKNIIGQVMFLRDLSEIFNLEEQIRFWAANGFIQIKGSTEL